MPPKRKNKATKPTPTAPFKAPPAASSGSQAMQAKRRNSLPGGKSRLAPSTPLHMTTRRAAKGASNHTSSGAPSVASSDSRRSSLDGIAHFDHAHSDIEDERPAKRARLSTDSGSPQQPALSFAEHDQHHSTVNGTQAPDVSKPASRAPSDDSKASSRKRRASDDSSLSSKTVSAGANGVLARSKSDLAEQQPRRKKRRTTQDAAESADQPPELTDSSTAPNSPEPEHARVATTQSLRHVLPTNGDAPAKLGRRLPGRRRAPHSDINVETDLRRQLNLKMNYRSLAKLQKSILEELSNRTTKNLQNDPDFFKQCPEYAPLIERLDQRKADRLAQVNALRAEKLAQLDRVYEATEHIEKEKFVKRFQDLQEDLLLQCFYRMKQIEREMRGADEAATDDGDHVIPPTHVGDFPTINGDDRLGSKYASRSRAYVETERLLDEDVVRKRFGQLRKDFVASDEDADDSIQDGPRGFAVFAGPDRTEAIAHWNIKSLLDAATDVESKPAPPPQVSQVTPNEAAEALLLLAQPTSDIEPPTDALPEQQPEKEEPTQPEELLRAESPIAPFAPEAAEIVPKPPHTLNEPIISRIEANGIHPPKYPEPPKNEIPARSTHRIMDMLNDDAEVPVSKPRDPNAHARDPTSSATPSHHVGVPPSATPPRGSLPGLDSIVRRQEPPTDRNSSKPQSTVLPGFGEVLPVSPGWTPRLPYLSGMSDEALRRRDPLNAIRAMLDAKALAEGKVPPSLRPDHPDNIRKAATEREQRERGQMPAPPLSRPFTPSGAHDKPEHSANETRRPSVGGYASSPSMPPLSYNQSPTPAHAHPPPHHGSQDTTSSQWGRSRSLSGSQAQQSYANSPPPPYNSELGRTGTHPPPHHSPYPSASAPQLPSISSTLAPKAPAPPPGPPPSNTINYRFAHYDPAPPPRSSYPSPNTAVYPPTSYPPPQYPPPPPQHSPQHYSAPPSYSGPPSYHSGYIPPPGSFQAPPPPTSAMSPYPPLKIHQYGGQPILPANMAPPLPQSQPSTSYPPHTAQPPPSTSYSPPQQHSIPPRNSSYDHNATASRDYPGERANESQSRQRRQYRSYHAPGTQFRTYQGPDSSRRRGG